MVQVQRGDGRTLTVRGSGLPPDEDYTVTLHSDPIVLGIVHTDATGSFELVATVPAGLTGEHHVVVESSLGETLRSTASGGALEAPVSFDAPPALAFTGSSPMRAALAGCVLVLLGLLLRRVRRGLA